MSTSTYLLERLGARYEASNCGLRSRELINGSLYVPEGKSCPSAYVSSYMNFDKIAEFRDLAETVTV